MSKTIEEQIEAAEKEVERCEYAVEDAESELSDAKDALEEAEESLAALEDERDAPERAEKEARKLADVAERTGPQRPIGDRVARTICDVSEIPRAFATAMRDGKLRGPVSVDGSKWASNGHWMIRVDSNDGMAPVDRPADDVIGPIGLPIVRDDVPVFNAPFHCRTFDGGTFALLEYTSLVEDLFPGVEWHARSESLTPIQALVNGTVVAVVMPVRPPS